MAKKIQMPVAVFDISLSEKDWTVLEEIGKVALLPTHRARLLDEMNLYRQKQALASGAIASGHVRPLLENLMRALRTTGDPLRDILVIGDAQYAAIREMRKAAALKRSLDVPGRDELDRLREQLRRWVAIIEFSLSALPSGQIPKKGDVAVRDLIQRAHATFLMAGGHGKRSAASIGFLRQVCDLAEYQALSHIPSPLTLPA